MGWVWPFRKWRCPFCFKLFYLGDAPTRSLSGSKEPDFEIGRFLRCRPPEMGRVERPKQAKLLERLWRRMWIRHDPDKKKICPHCHMYLPIQLAQGQLQGEILAIVGPRSAGKSTYFAVLLWVLEHRYAEEVGFSLFAQETFSVQLQQPVSSRDLYQTRYGHRLFTANLPLDGTHSAGQNQDILIPLIYRMQFPRRPMGGFQWPFSPLRAVDLVIFDAAGEDLEDLQKQEQFARYIAAASGIIFLLDPLAFPAVRNLLPSEVSQTIAFNQGNPQEVIDGAIRVLEQRNAWAAGQKFPIPVALTLTKIDLLYPLIKLVDPGSRLLQDSQHLGGFNDQDSQKCSRELQDYLSQWGAGSILRLLEHRFLDYRCFAVGALEGLPDQEGKIRISPYRIADPLLWLLWKRGYIGLAQTDQKETTR
ncbi:MAG: hypothetical protein NZ602_15420 [Thermoguttaceae bacterium]|nr:hypothetical protein [Thermoguttaceae bacterium]MDW8038386.1 hypothetical protein [Thermoguttaceae bacterium]